MHLDIRSEHVKSKANILIEYNMKLELLKNFNQGQSLDEYK